MESWFMKDYKPHPAVGERDWWPLVVIAVIATVAIVLGLNWDWVFGLRPHP